MNLDQIQHKLIAAARNHRPSERVPFGFEQRIMARVRALQVPDEWAQWARALWNAAAPCVVIMILMSAWSLFTPAAPPANSSPPAAADLTQALEKTLLAAVDQPVPSPESFSPDSLW
jgi:hypothetical protein